MHIYIYVFTYIYIYIRRRYRRISENKETTAQIPAHMPREKLRNTIAQIPAHIRKTGRRHADLAGWRRKNAENPLLLSAKEPCVTGLRGRPSPARFQGQHGWLAARRPAWHSLIGRWKKGEKPLVLLEKAPVRSWPAQPSKGQPS